MGIAEQMGRVLQRTSISVNIKERLDFSCALFDAHGVLGGLGGPYGRLAWQDSRGMRVLSRPWTPGCATDLNTLLLLSSVAGNLVSNAPHLPVHLGAMSEAVKYQIRHYASGGPGAADGLQVGGGSCGTVVGPTSPSSETRLSLLQEGDVLVSNHPQLAGGSHLPDITVITPVFDGGSIVFFVASRGHHAGTAVPLWDGHRSCMLHPQSTPP